MKIVHICNQSGQYIMGEGVSKNTSYTTHFEVDKNLFDTDPDLVLETLVNATKFGTLLDTPDIRSIPIKRKL